MTSPAIRLTFVACALAFAATTFAQPRTFTMEEDKSGVWSKVANHRAQANAAKSRGGFDEEDSRCGNVEIGNVDTGGSRRGAPREVITVVTGDVINAPARCK